ncbi:MAG: sugar phosphate isomerase/epimerase family protein [Deinococcota bacterium]
MRSEALNMTFGLGSYALAWAIGAPGYPPDDPLDVFGILRTAAANGFGLVQLADNIPLHELSEHQLFEVAQLADDININIEVGTRGIADDNLACYLELAKRFNSPILRVVVDSSGHEPSPAEVVDIIGEMLSQFADAEIVLAIENHDRFSAATLRDIIEDLASSWVGVCLDTVNSFGSLEGPAVVLNILAPYVVNLHIKDFTIAREPHNMGFRISGTPAGQGMLDIPWLVRQLPTDKRVITGIVELWPAPEPVLAETIAKEARWVAESAAFLQTL